MAYAAFSIDSNILYKRIHDLNRGLLAELGQFKTASVPFLLSDVVRRELHRRALEQAQESHATVMAALEEAREKRLAPIATIEALQTSLVTPETSAQAAIDTLIAVTGATPLPDSLADIAEVTLAWNHTIHQLLRIFCHLTGLEDELSVARRRWRRAWRRTRQGRRPVRLIPEMLRWFMASDRTFS